MTDPPLPERSEDWPDDPFLLLGVDQGVDDKSLKRAYTRLIRRYKPELAPVEFRRIRDAYEAVQQRIAWRQFERTFPTQEETGRSQADDAAAVSPSPETWAAASSALSFATELTRAWDAAVAGDLQGAYRLLNELQHKHPDNADLCVRRYWLLRLDPSLATQARPVDPLAKAVAQQGLIGAAGELYLEELTRDPDEALSDRCTRLLGNVRCQPRVYEVVRARWMHAARKQNWSLLESDLDRLRYRCFDDIALWLQLHLLALEHSVWSDDPDAANVIVCCRDEFHRHQHWSLNATYLFDQYDMLMELAADLAAIRKQSALFDLSRTLELAAMIGRGTPSGSPELRWDLSPFLSSWLDDPRAALNILDAIAKRSRGLCARLLSLIDTFPTSGTRYEEQLTGDELRAVLQDDIDERRRFCDLNATTRYDTLRLWILDFCLEEFADVDDVSVGLAELFPYLPAGEKSWFWHLTRDLPLRCVVRHWLTSWS